MVTSVAKTGSAEDARSLERTPGQDHEIRQALFCEAPVGPGGPASMSCDQLFESSATESPDRTAAIGASAQPPSPTADDRTSPSTSPLGGPSTSGSPLILEPEWLAQMPVWNAPSTAHGWLDELLPRLKAANDFRTCSNAALRHVRQTGHGTLAWREFVQGIEVNTVKNVALHVIGLNAWAVANDNDADLVSQLKSWLSMVAKGSEQLKDVRARQGAVPDAMPRLWDGLLLLYAFIQAGEQAESFLPENADGRVHEGSRRGNTLRAVEGVVGFALAGADHGVD